MRIEEEKLRQIYRNFAARLGADAAEAECFASCLPRADMRGHTTQGIGLLPYLVELLERGVMEFGRQPEIVRDNPASALIDGKRGVAGRPVSVARREDTLRPAQGSERVRLHGGSAAESIRDNKAHGIRVRHEEWQMIRDVAQRLQLHIPHGE